MPAHYTVRVDYAALQGLFEPAEGIGRFGARVNRRARALAKTFAPRESGALRASINYLGNNGTKQLAYTLSIGTNIKHGGWVNNGTYGPIYPKSSHWLSVGKRNPAHFGKVQYVYLPKGVRGQAAQHFLQEGMDVAFAESGIPIHVPRVMRTG